MLAARRFVEFEGEPYLDGCYQKLFGAAAGPEMQSLVAGSTAVRYAIHVPLLMNAMGTAHDSNLM